MDEFNQNFNNFGQPSGNQPGSDGTSGNQPGGNGPVNSNPNANGTTDNRFVEFGYVYNNPAASQSATGENANGASAGWRFVNPENVNTEHTNAERANTQADGAYANAGYGYNGGASNPNNDPNTGNGTPGGMPHKNQNNRKKGRIWLKIGGVLLAAIICFGAGFAGVLLGYTNLKPVVINQISEPADGEGNAAEAAPIPTLTGTAEENAKAIAAKVVPTVVAITTEQMTTNAFWGGSYVTGGAGSGVIISKDGYILTSAHVITGATNITVELESGEHYPATVVGSYVEGDIAMIKIEADSLDAATVGVSGELVQGETVYAVGNPEGTFSGSFTHGLISSLNRTIQVSVETENSGSSGYGGNMGGYSDIFDYFFGGGMMGGYGSTKKVIELDVIQFDAAISPGNSGGGLFNSKGELVGIVCAKSGDTNSEGLSFAVPIDIAQPIFTALISKGYYENESASSGNTNPNKAILGISVSEITSEQAAQNNLPGAGLYIVQVSAKTAYDAGLRPNDRIISVEDSMISVYDDLVEVLADKNVGDTVSVAVERGGKMLTVKVPLIENENAK